MSLNKSIIKEAAFEWFAELGYAVGHGPQMAPGEVAAERDTFGDVVLVGRLREAISRLNPSVPGEAWAVIKRYLKARFVRRLNP